MSLVSTYVRCADGRWYANPIYENEPGGPSWFICFDDDDPIEIVIAETEYITPATILAQLDIRYECLRPHVNAGRCFGPKNKIKPARSWFFESVKRETVFPVPSKHDGVFDARPHGQGVYYYGEAPGR